jgi:hypothetical protein
MKITPWPKISAELRITAAAAEARIQFNGGTTIWSTSQIEPLRAAILAHAAHLAVELDRPTPLTVRDLDGATHELAVHPDGIVQEINPDGTIPPLDGLLPVEASCRFCATPISIARETCTECSNRDPLSVRPPVLLPTPAAHPSDQPDPDAADPVTAPEDMTIMVPSKPPTTVLVLETEGEPSLSFTSTVLIGRRPEAAEGQTPLRVASPTREISRNHVTVALEADQVIVTDLGSVNGTYVNDHPIDAPTRVAPHDTIKIGDREFKARAAAREAVS